MHILVSWFALFAYPVAPRTKRLGRRLLVRSGNGRAAATVRPRVDDTLEVSV